MDKISFTVNGESYTLSGLEVSPTTTLNDYLRNYLQLYGTKSMCLEGGCGACVVAVSQTHPVTKEKHTFAVNSCLVHVLSCHQWDITTVEGIGNRKDGYHPVQSRLAKFNGTQCGYCTPGWVMNMYSLLEGSDNKLSVQQVENSFGGNLCRCTGYRPILDAFKSFANDADPELQTRLLDLEDLHIVKCAKKCERRCSVVDDEWCVVEDKQNALMTLGGNTARWYKAFSLQDVFQVLSREGMDSYELVAGNTGHGAFPRTIDARVYIDISSIEVLKEVHMDVNLEIGAGTTLTELMQLCRARGKDGNFKYLDGFLDHLDLVAHVPVRNIGTIGGNLAMKHAHPEFQSDLFLYFETVEAYVTLVDHTLAEQCISMQDFLKTDLTNKIIKSVKLPPFSNRNLIRSYKIMPRAQNSLAILNAGFYFQVDSDNKIEASRIAYSPVSPTFIRATETEQLLVGREMFNDDTLQVALRKLSDELVPVDDPPTMSPDCRRAIALGLFYRAYLSLCPVSQLNARFVSGATPLARAVSRGTQSFDTDKALWPLNKPIPKLEALTQCSGEVKYACDVTASNREVHVAFVLSTICLGEIESFDASEALALPGVVAFFTAKDIPGRNSFTSTNVPWTFIEEEILASKTISYHGQPIGLIAAVTRKLALKAAGLVRVTYKRSTATPVLTIEEALVAPDKDRRLIPSASSSASSRGDGTTHVVKGSVNMPSQYHFTMETHSCHATNTSTGVHIRSATQWLDLVHIAAAQMLAIDQSKVQVSVHRVGGGYGGKASRSALAACACALVARLLGRPASLHMSLHQHMVALGKRQRVRADYEAGVNNDGVIQYVKLVSYSDCGFNGSDSASMAIPSVLGGLYDTARWDIQAYDVITDKASNTWCRSPGTTEGTAIGEYIMEHIAHVTKKDPIDVRMANLAAKNTSVRNLVDILKRDSNYDQRKSEIATFNANNAWKKKGIKLSIMSFPLGYSGNFSVTLSVYHGDGTVRLCHSGIEMGQGINTKVAQVCAYTLEIPLEKVTVGGSDSFVSPNAMASNGSVTSDSVAYATIKACNALLDRLKPVDGATSSWDDMVKAAYNRGECLQSSFMMSQLDQPSGYDIAGACVSEVELDVLTGQHAVTRVDLLEDVGVSISPDVDVGQIEGSFVMGLGLWTSEELAYDKSGRQLTGNTWTYHPPGAKDIPVDFRISFSKNTPNPLGVLRSKATGEPALTLCVSVPLALRAAVGSARTEFGYSDAEWLDIETPFNAEHILKAIAPKIENFKTK